MLKILQDDWKVTPDGFPFFFDITLTSQSCLATLKEKFWPCVQHQRIRRDGVVVRASASQSVDLGFIPLVESYQQTLKNGIHSFPAWRSAFMGGCGEQAGKFACCVLGRGT